MVRLLVKVKEKITIHFIKYCLTLSAAKEVEKLRMIPIPRPYGERLSEGCPATSRSFAKVDGQDLKSMQLAEKSGQVKTPFQ